MTQTSTSHATPGISHQTEAKGEHNAPTAGRLPWPAVAFVGLFGVLLTSFPARNADLWEHLVAGRDLLHSGFGPTWVFDLALYLGDSVAGGVGLVGLKAVLAGAMAVLLLRLSAVSGWRVPLAVTGLTTLVAASRLLLQPETASVFLLAGTMWLLHRDRRPTSSCGVWPGWPLVLLFAVWCNVDARFVIGLVVVALTWLGRVLDDRGQTGFAGPITRWAGMVGILVAASCLSPSHVLGLRVPDEIVSAVKALRASDGGVTVVNSPFDADYVRLFWESSAALAYYPLLVLGALSFLLNRRGWRWGWVLPWVALAVVSGLQVRTAPLFAVVAGPITAWNLQAYFASRTAAQTGRPTRSIGLVVTGVVGLAFLVAAWPGWLQGPPHEPRRWAVEAPPALRTAAEFVARSHADGVWEADTRTLHVSAETFAPFAWFCPQDAGVRDDEAVTRLRDLARLPEARERLRELRVTRAVVSVADPNPIAREVLDQLLVNPTEWRVLSLAGGVVVFAWVDPVEAERAERLKGWEVDFDRLAYHPNESETAPGTPPPDERRWWDVFWRPAYPTRPPERDEASVLLRKANLAQVSAPVRHLTTWEVGHIAGLVAAGSGWTGPGAASDAAWRLTLFRPPLPEAPDTPPTPAAELTLALQRQFTFDRGLAPVGVVYAAVRAARRAVAANPNDPNSHLILARAYAAAGTNTAEAGWAARVPQIQRVRVVQQTAALNRAVRVNPRLASAHLELANLYRRVGCLDLAVEHLRAYRELPPLWGGPAPGDEFTKTIDAELKQVTRTLAQRTETYEEESAKASVSERALLAVQLELGGRARDLLLKSDVSAFGTQGIELELDLLLRTGRPEDVLAWTYPELKESLGGVKYHWFRAQAHLALGEYDAGDGELAAMADADGLFHSPAVVGQDVAKLIGKSLLDAQAGPNLFQQLLWGEVNRSDPRGAVAQLAQQLGRQADMTVLRGVIALEAGNIPRARETFHAALSYSLPHWGGGQLEFEGRAIAWDVLDRIGEATKP